LSDIRVDTISAANGTDPVTLTKQSAAKAWVNFNGSGTVAIRDSQGVSGLIDNGTGDYTVSYSNSFSAAEYVAQPTRPRSNLDGGATIITGGFAAGTTQMQCYTLSSRVLEDQAYNFLTAHGDLA
jgi:hypothetical protein